MKLQHLIVIFVIIVLPLTLILSAYTSKQIETLKYLNQYDTKLMDATYDGIKAFEINASYNDLSDTTDSLKEDVQAAISAFMQSLAVNMGVGGYNVEQIRSYIPAVLFTLYDGYYIYAPTKVNDSYEYILRPYNYYTIRYKQDTNNDVIINYTLDNYMAVYGWINGEYVVNSGYLIKNRETVNNNEELKFYAPRVNLQNDNDIIVPFTSVTVTDDYYNNSIHRENDDRTEKLYPMNESFYINPESAKNYYDDAETFTNWVTNNLSNWVRVNMAMRNGEYLKDDVNLKADFDRVDLIFKKGSDGKLEEDPEDIDSLFSVHKTNVIKQSIQDNLNQAITAYSEGSTTSYEFKLPILNADEWNTISRNIGMLTFMQGVPCVTKYYNNYALVISTTNKLYATQDNLYFTSNGDSYYHKINCKELKTDSGLVGYSATDFEPKRVKAGENIYIYYYRHMINDTTVKKACYHCIINSDHEYEYNEVDAGYWKNTTVKREAYYTTLARIKYNQYKTTVDLRYGV